MKTARFHYHDMIYVYNQVKPIFIHDHNRKIVGTDSNFDKPVDLI